MTGQSQEEFSRIRAFLWPVHRHELRKFLPMFIMFFLVTLNYNILHTMKDALVVTGKSSGAEVIPFIKVWVMFPMSVLMTFAFTRLMNHLNREYVVYVMMGTFLLFFLLFAFVLYPARETLHPHAFADQLQGMLPLGLKGMVAMLRNWSFTGFYVMAELWSCIVYSLLFWGFANEITSVSEAKRFYGPFGIGINLSGAVAGQLSVLLSQNVYHPNFPFGSTAWEQSLVMLISIVLFSGVLILAIFRYMHQQVLSPEEKGLCYRKAMQSCQEDASKRLSIRESFGFLFKSKYLLYLAIIVVGYNIVINLVEVVWKHQVKEMYPNPSEFNTYMGEVKTVIGIVATLTAVFVSGNSIRKLGWTFTALITPVILAITSLGFFGFFFFRDAAANISLLLLGATPLAVTVFFGSAQNCLARASKYTVFDATKELAFVPLSPEARVKGKASIDGVCSRLGKSGGSVIHQILLVIFSTISASAPYVAGVLFLVVGGWIAAASALGREFNLLAGVKSRPEVQPVLSSATKAKELASSASASALPAEGVATL